MRVVTPPRALAILVLIVSGALAASVIAGPDAPSPVVYPLQRLPLTFSHALHTGKLALACTSCHDRAATSRSAVDLLTPGEASCRGCHPIDRARPDASCAKCHDGFDPGHPQAVARVSIPTANLKFSHAAHATTACVSCHPVEDDALATRDHLPHMASCLDCHDGTRAGDACTTCHLADAGGRVRTALPDGELEPTGGVTGAAHDADFRRHHAALARSEARTCASCHREEFCADCHLGVVKPMDFHAGDYLSIHAIEARRGVPDCTACHRTQSFCVGCHERSGVGVRAESGFSTSGDSGRFHPPGWAGAGGPNDHAREAQKNLRQCASCHRDDFCASCHTAEPGHMNVSPHGPGWATSSRCRALADRNPRLCLRCHDSGAPPCR